MNSPKRDLHIVFRNTQGVLKAGNFLGGREAEIVDLHDDLCVGPIRDLDSNDGLRRRTDWLAQMVGESECPAQMLASVVSDPEKIRSIAEKINGYRKLYVWAGVNASERFAAARLLALLPENDLPVYMADFSEIAVPNINGEIVYPKSLMQTAPFQVAEVPVAQFTLKC